MACIVLVSYKLTLTTAALRARFSHRRSALVPPMLALLCAALRCSAVLGVLLTASLWGAPTGRFWSNFGCGFGLPQHLRSLPWALLGRLCSWELLPLELAPQGVPWSHSELALPSSVLQPGAEVAAQLGPPASSAQGQKPSDRELSDPA